MIQQFSLTFHSKGRELIEIDNDINRYLSQISVAIGSCHLFLCHTSASLLICENDDPSVKVDLENFMQKIAPDGDQVYKHRAEGEDDMPSHIRSVLTGNSLTIPITNNRLALGRWQSIYLWEHRYQPHQRHLILTIQG